MATFADRLRRNGNDPLKKFLRANGNGRAVNAFKQPKRAVISCEKGYVEISEYPRAEKAIFVDAETGNVTEIFAGESTDALFYELNDMEQAILSGDASAMKLNFSKDVMDIMTTLRKEWKLQYPNENW